MPTHPRPGDTVTLHYRLACGGREIVNTFQDEPDTFTLGRNQMDPRLEALVLSLEEGQRTIYQLEAGQAFGLRDETLVHHLARDEFPDQAALVVGNYVEFPMPNGEVMLGTITHVGASQVQVDFNHPLAGLGVEFDVELLTVNRTQAP